MFFQGKGFRNWLYWQWFETCFYYIQNIFDYLKICTSSQKSGYCHDTRNRDQKNKTKTWFRCWYCDCGIEKENKLGNPLCERLIEDYFYLYSKIWNIQYIIINNHFILFSDRISITRKDDCIHCDAKWLNSLTSHQMIPLKKC